MTTVKREIIVFSVTDTARLSVNVQCMVYSWCDEKVISVRIRAGLAPLVYGLSTFSSDTALASLNHDSFSHVNHGSTREAHLEERCLAVCCAMQL